MNRSIKRVHLVYPSGPKINCPEAIGWHLSHYLGRRLRVDTYHWARLGRLRPDPEAALIGHPHPVPFTLFRQSAAQPGWGRVLMLAPFNASPRYLGWYAPALEHCDEFLAIAGPYWWKGLDRGPFARWSPRMRRLDLAVDRRDFPRVKRSFAPKGRRRFLYIGYAGWPKNTDYLSALARRRPDWDFHWIGSGAPIPGLRNLGRQDFADPAARRLVAGYDFILSVSTADANPATLLEGMAWGLVPVCTPQSGYEGEAGIVNLPLDDLDGALAVLDRLQAMPDAGLRALVRLNDAALRRRFHWDRFGAEVAAALRPAPRAPIPAASATEAAAMAWRGFAGPYGAWRPRWLAQVASQFLRPRGRIRQVQSLPGPQSR